MNANKMTPQRYLVILEEYDQILAHARAMSERLVGRTVTEKHMCYAETIFTKLLCHAVSLRKISPNLVSVPLPELWDIGSLCAVARSLIEAFDAFAYIGLHGVLQRVQELRLLVWELHGKEHRLHMLEEIGSVDADVNKIRSDAKILQVMVTAHASYKELPKGVQKMISDGKAPAYLQSKRDRNAASGINHYFYNSATMFLSQYVHTTPFALSQLELSHAGDPDALQLVAMPLQYSMSFLAKTIVGVESLWPETRLPKSARLRRILGLWLVVAEKGVRGVG